MVVAVVEHLELLLLEAVVELLEEEMLTLLLPQEVVEVLLDHILPIHSGQ
jgi:hypothetical protein